MGLVSGLDHADIRVASVIAVEPFYDALMPALGLSRKTESHVARDGEWYEVDSAANRPRNAIEYHTPIELGVRGWFVGLIEDALMHANKTRIAFAVADESDLDAAEDAIRTAGARVIERSNEPGYAAVFFEDPVGTRLEIVARALPT